MPSGLNPSQKHYFFQSSNAYILCHWTVTSEIHKTAQLSKPNSSILLWIALFYFVFSILRRHLYYMYKYLVRKKSTAHKTIQ